MLINYAKTKVCENVSDHEWKLYPPGHKQAYRWYCVKCGISSYIGPSYQLLEKYQKKLQLKLAERREGKMRLIKCVCPTCGGESIGFTDREGTEALTCWNCTIKEIQEADKKQKEEEGRHE